MNAVVTAQLPQSGVRPDLPGGTPVAVEFRYTQTESFVALLQELRVSLLVSTYQANKLLAVRACAPLAPLGSGPRGEGLSTLVRTFDRPMGMAADSNRLAIGTRDRIWLLRNAPDIAPQVEPAGLHDACYLPRSCHVTGDIGVHEMAWGRSQEARDRGPEAGVRGQESRRSEDSAVDPCPLTPDPCLLTPELWIVNTRFSCLCTLDPDYSFVPRWRPPFITRLGYEDRCHLNGLAMVDGRPRYVTALGETDTPDGWRAVKAAGGCLMDMPTSSVVARGLSMPHSPRWHEGRLWVLESGTGGVVQVDLASGRRETIAALPGFTRGLALRGPYAFVGLSKIRPTSAMDGVPLAERRHELKCGIAAVDLRNGTVAGLLEFQTAVEEIFDVQILDEARFPEIVGFQKEAVQHTFVVPR
jgi:hypothetical protein